MLSRVSAPGRCCVPSVVLHALPEIARCVVGLASRHFALMLTPSCTVDSLAVPAAGPCLAVWLSGCMGGRLAAGASSSGQTGLCTAYVYGSYKDIL